MIGLIGPNGAGSPRRHAITGLVAAHAGDVLLHGRSILGRSWSRSHDGVALVPEGRRIFADFSVDENLRPDSPPDANGTPGARWRRSTAFPVLREARRRSAGALSGVAAAACDRARLLQGRGATARRALGRARPWSTTSSTRWRASGSRASRSCSSSNGLSARSRLADRTHVLTNGELRMTLAPADADDTDKIIAAYLAS